MFDLDVAIDQWVDTLIVSHPVLADHADELADHLLMRSRAEMSDGVSPEAALDLAIAALGAPDQLAAEFRRTGGLMSILRCLGGADSTRSTREQLMIAAAWVGLSLVWAGAMIVVDDSMHWMLAGWTLTTFLPLTAVDARLRRM